MAKLGLYLVRLLCAALMVPFFAVPSLAQDFEIGGEFLKSLEAKFNARNGHPDSEDPDYVHFCTGTTTEREACKSSAGSGKKVWRIGEDVRTGGYAETPQKGPPGWEPPADITYMNPYAIGELFPEVKTNGFAKEKICILILEHEFKHTGTATLGGELIGGKVGDDAEDPAVPEPCDHLGSHFELLDDICAELGSVWSNPSVVIADKCAAASVLCAFYRDVLGLIYIPGNAGHACPGLPTVFEGEVPPTCALCIGGSGGCQSTGGVVGDPELDLIDYGTLEG